MNIAFVEATKVLLSGAIGLALVLMLGAIIEVRTLASALFTFAIGLMIGSIFLTPVAAFIAFRQQLGRWVNRHGNQFQPCASFALALALGYLFGSLRGGVSDISVGVALLILYLLALAKVLFATLRSGPGYPGTGGPWDPPHAPVRRPPGGKPPVLGAAARIEQEVLSESVFQTLSS